MMNFVRGIAMAGAVGVLACGGDDPGDITEPDPTQIRVSVTADGSAESGVPVSLFAPGGTAALESATTNTSGQATFTGVEAGSYEVEVEVPAELELADGQTARRAVTVADGATASVTFALVTPLPADVEVVTLQSASFSPAEVTIDAGMTIRWVNGAAITHTITPSGHSEWPEQTVTANGQTFEHTFDTAGSYPYLCEFHAGMTGTVTVN